MKRTLAFIFATTLLLLSSSLSNAQISSVIPVTDLTPSPAPAPEPPIANISQLLQVAGPFHIFLKYLQTTKVIDILENQANNTKEGLTLFVPKDDAFTALKNPSLTNLTNDQLKQLCLFHALPHYYSLSDFKNLSNVGPVPTFAGGDFTLNFTDVSGTVHMTSGWSVTKISSSVRSTAPVAIYQVDKVLLPEALFGTDIPPTPAPSPDAEASTPTADSPATDNGDEKSSKSPKDSSTSCRVMGKLVWALVGVLVVLTL